MKQSNKKSQYPQSAQNGGPISDGVKNLDIMGEKFKFNYSTTGTTFKTRLGGIVTLAVTLVSLVALVFISSQYFDTSSPVVTTNRELSSSVQSTNLYGKDVVIAVSVTSGGLIEPLKMNNIITLVGQFLTKTVDPSTNTTKVDLSKKFSYKPCPQIGEDRSVVDLLEKLVDNVDLRIFLCPNFKEVDYDVTISSDPEKLSSTSLSLKVYPCSLADRNDCYTRSKMLRSKFSYIHISHLISPSKYEDPVELRATAVGQSIDLSRTKSFRFLFEQHKIYLR